LTAPVDWLPLVARAHEAVLLELTSQFRESTLYIQRLFCAVSPSTACRHNQEICFKSTTLWNGVPVQTCQATACNLL